MPPVDTRVMFLMGPPTSGKSTIAKRLEGFERISPGEMLRTMRERGDDLGSYIKHNWNHASLVPIVNALIYEEIGRAMDKNVSVVIDGFPRTVEEADQIPHICRGCPSTCVELVLSEEDVRQRTTERQREGDDTPEAVDIRLKSYYDNMEKLRPRLVNLKQLDARQNIEKQVVDLIENENSWQRQTIPPCKERTRSHSLLHRCGVLESCAVVQKTLRLAQATRLWKQFCGTHPVSLDLENIRHITQYPYLVSIKADGYRNLVVVANQRLYFVNRKLEVWGGLQNPDLAPFEDSLLDGEMVDSHRFVVIDILAISGKNVMHDPILDRLRASRELGGLLCRCPIRFSVQRYWQLRDVHDALRYNGKEWRTDGIVFTPAKLPYRLGVDRNMMKWKPAELNTLDLIYRKGELHCQSQTRKSLISMGTPEKRPDWLREDMIVECLMVAEQVWRCLKPRMDKSHPNVDWVADRVLRSIRDNITLDDLLHELARPRRRRAMIKPTQLQKSNKPKETYQPPSPGPLWTPSPKV